jgi:DNA-binding NarL/FixJ family response regulator
MSNAEIAAALYISAGTAKTHVARLLAKLGGVRGMGDAWHRIRAGCRQPRLTI